MASELKPDVPLVETSHASASVSGVKRKAEHSAEVIRAGVSEDQIDAANTTISSEGLPLADTIEEVPARLVSSEPAAKGPHIERANELLLQAGVTKSELSGASFCLRAGIGRKLIPFAGKPKDLDKVIITGKCPFCGHNVAVTIRDILQQTDYAGDREDGDVDASVHCPEESCGEGIYVTELCKGKPFFDTGDFHNHCTHCPDGGECLSDFRIAHCVRCGHNVNIGEDVPCGNCGEEDPVGSGISSEQEEDLLNHLFTYVQTTLAPKLP
jgi:hypothetical protein